MTVCEGYPGVSHILLDHECNSEFVNATDKAGYDDQSCVYPRMSAGLSEVTFLCSTSCFPCILPSFFNSLFCCLLSSSYSNTALHYACDAGSALLVQTLMRKGAEMSKPNADGKSSFSTANQKMKQVLSDTAAERTFADVRSWERYCVSTLSVRIDQQTSVVTSLLPLSKCEKKS